MYTVTHLDEYAQRPAFPEPVPRPGSREAAPSTASAYSALEHVPAIAPEQLGAWLSA